MDEFQLPKDQEDIRRALFPDLTSLEYAAMVRRKQNEFGSMSKEEQDKVRASADRFSEAVADMTAKAAEMKKRTAAILEHRHARNAARVWRKEQGYAGHWVPGCIAVDEKNYTWTAIAGNEQDGALMWLPSEPVA